VTSLQEDTRVGAATPSAGRPPGRLEGRVWLLAAFGLLAVVMAVMLSVAQTGPGALRAPVPSGLKVYVVNGHPQTVRPFLGWTGWIYLWQCIGFGGGALLLGIFGYRSWKARKMDTLFGLTLAAGGMFAFDPFYNWLGYFPTNPAFLHLPRGASAWSDLAPTFEPLFFFPLYMVWLIVPALITNVIWIKLHARGVAKRGEGAWSDRHPIVTRLIVSKFVCFPLDLGGFRIGCLTLAFIFSQSPGPTIGAGQSTQSQLLWEPLLFELIMMATSLLMYRNKEGLTLQGRLARRIRTAPRFPNLTEVATAWCILALAYVACLSGMAALRFTGANGHLGQPWPYANTIAYDPDGLFKAACAPNVTRTGLANFDLIRPTAKGPCTISP
jgi:Spirocyclase AveC-like